VPDSRDTRGRATIQTVEAPHTHRAATPKRLQCDVALAGLTTLGLGGPARCFLRASTEDEVVAAFAWGRQEGLPVAVIGGGSNLVIADAGFPGLVIEVATRGVTASAYAPGEPVLITAAAGEIWDELVARCVSANWAGVECLSGIPGRVGATPIQNVGAYGQEVAETICRVRVLDTRGGDEPAAVCEMTAVECGFGYRDSLFRREPGRFVVLAVTFALRPGGAAAVRYGELARALETAGDDVSLGAVREAVLALRRTKSMVADPGDPDSRSAGSFFTNPILATSEAEAVVQRALASGAARTADEVPRFASGDGLVKLSAAWLIERAGFSRGTRRGNVGISSKHTLALVHLGGGSAAELVALAREVQCGVDARFGVLLRPEPVFLGFATADPVSGACGTKSRCR
jgi:UDP-N-acetylmuramate dehydrogenase